MNRAIPDHIVEEVRQRTDIVELIGSFIPLKRGGAGVFKGLCPFHNEKTPSFTVNSSRQVYHCFGCGKGGDAFRFMMDKEGVDFPNAIHLLAARCGVVIPEKSFGLDEKVSRERSDARTRLYKLMEDFASFFERELTGSAGAAYLDGRGIDGDTIKKFRLGYAPDSWDACLNYGRNLGYREAELEQSGIVRKNENSSRYYDFFKGRLMFPIWNETGKVVGFSARTLEKDAKIAKYVNTPETPIFKKGDLLYALCLARSAIHEEKKVILCEGQLDCIAFHRAGVNYAVAPQGTGFTESQARMLKRYTDCAILAFDSDSAGQKAILRAAEILLPLDFEVKVMNLPGGKDPDELYKSGGAGALQSAADNTVSWLEKLCGSFQDKHDMKSAAGRSRAAAEALDYIKLVGNSVTQDLYLKQAAELLQLNEISLRTELESRRRADIRKVFRQESADVAPEERKEKAANHPGELTILELALNFDFVPRFAAAELSPEYLGEGSAGEAVKLILRHQNDHAAGIEAVKALLSQSADPVLSKILVSGCSFSLEEAEKAVHDCIVQLKKNYVRKQSSALRAKLALAADETEMLDILKQIQELEK